MVVVVVVQDPSVLFWPRFHLQLTMQPLHPLGCPLEPKGQGLLWEWPFPAWPSAWRLPRGALHWLWGGPGLALHQSRHLPPPCGRYWELQGWGPRGA